MPITYFLILSNIYEIQMILFNFIILLIYLNISIYITIHIVIQFILYLLYPLMKV